MPIPDFLRDLRSHVGHRLLFMPSVVAVVVDDQGRILLGRRADSGRWALISGICEPGEQPALTAVREVYEETAVHAVPERLVGVYATDPVEYANGDRAQYMDTVLLCRAVGGEACVNDDESLDVRWFTRDTLPELPFKQGTMVDLALRDEPAWFEPVPQTATVGAPAPAATVPAQP
jgi:8-oxo-dGTP pyrophosphatase MutT (NUDIX family)